MPKRVKNLRLTEVSHVDEGANQHAKMSLVKSLRNPVESGQLPIPGVSKEGDPMTDPKITKTLEGLESKVAAAEMMIEKLDAELKVEKRATKDLTAHIDAAGTHVWKRDDKGAVEFSARNDEDFVTIEGERMLKSAVPGPMLKMATKVAEMEKRAEAEDLNKRITADIPTFGGAIEHRRALIKAIDSIADDEGDNASATRDGVMAILKAVNKVGKTAFTSVGTSDPDAGSDGTARGDLDALVKAYAADHKVSVTEATAAVMKTAEGAALFAKRRNG